MSFTSLVSLPLPVSWGPRSRHDIFPLGHSAPRLISHRHQPREVKARSFGELVLKQLGFTAASQPDLEAPGRKKVLDRLLDTVDASIYTELLDHDFLYLEEGVWGKTIYGKEEWMAVMGQVLAALPDFNWTHVTDGVADREGYAIVIVKVSGHHTGATFTLPGRDLKPVAPSGRRISVREGAMRVKVLGGKVKSISVLPGSGAGLDALYRAVSGEDMLAVHLAPGAGRASYADDSSE